MNWATRAGRPTLAIMIVTLLGGTACTGSEDSSDGAPATSNETESPDTPLSEAAQQSLDAALVEAMDRYHVPGAVVAVTTPDGRWEAEQGLTELENGDAVSTEMAWPLRSLTKSVVVTALLQLVDEEAVGLDDTIDTYIDDVPNGDEITLRQLASMTSGVGDYTQSDAFIESLMDDPSQQYSLEELDDYGLAEGPQFEPGTDHVYSNTSTNLLAVVIEQVTGNSIADVVNTRIVEELDLTETIYPTSDDDWTFPHAQGFQPVDGEVEPSFNNFSAMGASGAMISTTADMTVWVEALGNGSLISPELQAERLVGAPLSEGPEYDQYAVGIGELNGWWGHTGEGLGFTSLAMYEPETGSTIVIFMNISQAVDQSADGDPSEEHVPTLLMREFTELLDS